MNFLKKGALLFRNQLFLVFSHERYSTVDSVIIHTSKSETGHMTKSYSPRGNNLG